MGSGARGDIGWVGNGRGALGPQLLAPSTAKPHDKITHDRLLEHRAERSKGSRGEHNPSDPSKLVAGGGFCIGAA
jgi:hypothetical protein